MLGISQSSNDSYGRAKRLQEQTESVLSALEAYRKNLHNVLPPPVLASIDGFTENHTALIGDKSGISDLREERVWAALVFLNAFESEVSYLMSDGQEAIRARSERAFVHLQRQIAADMEFRKKWTNAFEDGNNV
jgi:hypothetical protein